MKRQAAPLIPLSGDSNFPAASLAIALDWHLAGGAWPASKACAFALLLSAAVDGICDAAECDPNFSEAAACEYVQDAHVLIAGRRWHSDRILKAAVSASVNRVERSCTAICDAFSSSTLSPAPPSSTAVDCVSSIFLISRNVAKADLSWRSVSACVLSWCAALLPSCQAEEAPQGTAESCFRVLSLVAGAVRAQLCLDFLTASSCVQLVCVCCELQCEDDSLRYLCIELLDKILSFSAPTESSLKGCAVPVTGFGPKCSLVWQPLCPFGLSLVQPFSTMLVSFLVSMLLRMPSAGGGDATKATIPQVTALNCLRCLNCLLWHDENARHEVLKIVESLALALTACACSPQTTVQHAAAFVRCTVLLRCSDVDFKDNDGLSSAVSQRHLLHVFPELLRLRSSSRPQSSSRLRPLSASSPAVVAWADIVFSSGDNECKVIHMHGLMHAALADILQLPCLLSEYFELVCALLDTATVICLSSDRSRAKLSDMGSCSEVSLWKVLQQAMQSSPSCVRVSALQLASALRHNSECLAIMSCSSSFISALRRSIQHLSCEEFSNWDIKAAACACSLLHSIVIISPPVASSLLYGRRFGRTDAPVESALFATACLQRVHREEDEASDNDEPDEMVLGVSSQIFDVENDSSDATFVWNESSRPPHSPLSTQSRRLSLLAHGSERSASPFQLKKTMCVGAHGLKRQQRLMDGLEQCILSDSLSCRCSSVMLAAELAATFVSDGQPALAAANAPAFEPNSSSFSLSSVSEPAPTSTFSFSSRQRPLALRHTIRIVSSTHLRIRIALLLTDSRCIEAAATLFREGSPCMHLVRAFAHSANNRTSSLLTQLQMACSFMTWSIRAGAAMQMRTQLHVSNSLIHTLDAALARVLDAHPVIDPLVSSANAPDASKPLSPSKALTKIKYSEQQNSSLLCDDAPTFSSAQVAAPADACVWPAASKQLAAVAVLDAVLRGLTQVLNASDTGVARHFSAHDWGLLTSNLRILIQRGKYFDLPQLRHKNVQSDATTAAALQLLAACVRAKCNYATIIQDSSFLEAVFGIMNNPGAAGPNAALAAVLELAKSPDSQRALSSTFGYMTGTKAGAAWKNSSMSKMSREIKRLCAGAGSPASKSPARGSSSVVSIQNDVDEDEDFPYDDAVSSSPLLPPISAKSKSSRADGRSPASRLASASDAKTSPVSSPHAHSPAPARASPNVRAGTGASRGVRSPAVRIFPPLS